MVSHVGHTEHDVDILVTEHRQPTCAASRRASAAATRGGQTPHILMARCVA